MNILTIFIALCSAVSLTSTRVQLHGRWSVNVGPLAFPSGGTRSRRSKSPATPPSRVVAVPTERLAEGARHLEILHRSTWSGRV
jgi:hypothetical protein